MRKVTNGNTNEITTESDSLATNRHFPITCRKALFPSSR